MLRAGTAGCFLRYRSRQRGNNRRCQIGQTCWIILSSVAPAIASRVPKRLVANYRIYPERKDIINLHDRAVVWLMLLIPAETFSLSNSPAGVEGHL